MMSVKGLQDKIAALLAEGKIQEIDPVNLMYQPRGKCYFTEDELESADASGGLNLYPPYCEPSMDY